MFEYISKNKINGCIDTEKFYKIMINLLIYFGKKGN